MKRQVSYDIRIDVKKEQKSVCCLCSIRSACFSSCIVLGERILLNEVFVITLGK